MILSLLLSSMLYAETPVRIDDEGVYYYKPIKKSREKETTKHGEVIKYSDGSYQYRTEPIETRTKESAYGAPTRVSGKASFYQREVSPQDKAITVNFVSMDFTDFTSEQTRYSDVYEATRGILVDFEWHKVTPAIKFGYILSGGFMAASGTGKFVNNPGFVAREKYQMLIAPLSAKVRMNFEYSDRQYIVPYLDAGAGVYGLVERREDGKDTNQAYTPFFAVGGGLNFLMDWLNEQALAKLDNDYGVNHIWLNISYHLVTATDSDFDLSSNQLQFGFKFDY